MVSSPKRSRERLFARLGKPGRAEEIPDLEPLRHNAARYSQEPDDFEETYLLRHAPV